MKIKTEDENVNGSNGIEENSFNSCIIRTVIFMYEKLKQKKL